MMAKRFLAGVASALRKGFKVMSPCTTAVRSDAVCAGMLGMSLCSGTVATHTSTSRKILSKVDSSTRKLVITQRLYSVSGSVSVNHSVSLSVISALVQCSTPAGIEVGVELHCLARGSQVAALHTPNRCHLQTPQLHVSGCGTPLSSSG